MIKAAILGFVYTIAGVLVLVALGFRDGPVAMFLAFSWGFAATMFATRKFWK